MTNRTKSLCIGAAVLFAVLFQCDGEVFVRMSRIRLLVEQVYPLDDPDKPVYINSAVVATFNKRIDKRKFTKNMLQVKGPDGQTIGGSFHVAGKTIVFTPGESTPLKKGSKHAVEITDLVDTDGNVLKQASADFYTKNTADTDVPKPAKVMAQGMLVSVFFNEPLLNHKLQQDAVTVFDETAQKPIQRRGKLLCINFTNTIVFTANSPLKLDHKYKISIHGNKGIIDLANNELNYDPKVYTIFPIPFKDTKLPYITKITSDYYIQSMTIHFSERIDTYHTLSDNRNHFKQGLALLYQLPNPPEICTRGISPYPIDTCRNKGIFSFTAGFNDDHTAITIDLTTNDFLGYSLFVVVHQDAFKDLAGNRLTSGPVVLYKESTDQLVYVCPAL